MQKTYANIAMLLLLAAGAAPGQAESVRPLFEGDVPLKLRLEAPFRELRRTTDEREERDAILRYFPPTGDEIVFDVELRVRGKSRLELCSFPPLRVDFDDDALDGTIFAGQDHLKLVTLCQERDAYRTYLAQEYQIYKAYNALTDYSFRVRWATLEYVVTDNRRGETFTEPAFFIEEDWEVAQRHGMEALELPEVPLPDLDPRHAALLALFQYMIANTDWSAISAPPDESCCHNSKPIGSADSPVIVLPYDFDQAGLINAGYARPRSHLPIISVRQRLYRGQCALNDELGWAVQQFNAKRTEIERVFRSQPELIGDRTRRRTLRYISDFYEIINDPQALRERIVDACRQ